MKAVWQGNPGQYYGSINIFYGKGQQHECLIQIIYFNDFEPTRTSST